MTARVEPEWAMATIAFVDIRGFTTYADKATAREAVAYLTEFFEAAVPVVTAHGGRVDKLLGDGMLVVFGAPDPLPDHADRAVAAAGELVDAVQRAMGDRCRVGVGINSGLVLVGTMGAGDLQSVEVVGDPVNVAARVQDATRDLGERVLLTDATRMLLEHAPALVAHAPLELKGKSRPVRLFGLRPVTDPGRPATTTATP